MNRTKLDEIMNEEINGAPPDEPRSAISIYAIDRIAERSFRHGVEQAVMDHAGSIINQGFWTPRDKIQPAPAEEKPYYDSGLEYKGVPWKWSNRRHGERRKS